ncbi:methylenetetrahydrofolate reductase C-terminal domain-containing protein [Thauera sinica]|uniref:Methylenetetrahydrofolate reductase n=1 Tax=Thauera sinica TaxID=2665146 RepID=A0ABW1ANF8_9RHOO|nr:methylenetetrahydrofolate reductase C-terminal domain-containing protein [Thauera sp. K11]
MARALAGERFAWLLECIPAAGRRPEADYGALIGPRGAPDWLSAFAVTDRVLSPQDPDPLPIAGRLLQASGRQPLLHFAGKDRELAELRDRVRTMQQMGLRNLLLLSGDRLPGHGHGKRIRYLESVAAVAAVRRWQPDWLLGVAVNPFKYREEDGMLQYLKLSKKLRAGASFAITQVGFDPDKHVEALGWMADSPLRRPLLACVMPLSAARARHLRRYPVPGITVSDSLLALLEEDARRQPDGGRARVLHRLALQIVHLRRLGYAGIQLTGIRNAMDLQALADSVDALARDCADQAAWESAWRDHWCRADGTPADPRPPGECWRPGQGTVRASPRERYRYRVFAATHALLFQRGPLAAAFAWTMRAACAQPGTMARGLERLERAVKHPLLGCETCGQCRLASTQFVCPETCPKGLANGACGGTTQNRCEFGEQECIHSVRYRIAKETGALNELESVLVPAIPAETRHSSSWPAWFIRQEPHVRILDASAPGTSIDTAGAPTCPHYGPDA